MYRLDGKCRETSKGEIVDGFDSYREVRGNKDLTVLRRPQIAVENVVSRE